jgi:hypothetical protein
LVEIDEVSSTSTIVERALESLDGTGPRAVPSDGLRIGNDLQVFQSNRGTYPRPEACSGGGEADNLIGQLRDRAHGPTQFRLI